VTVFKKAYSPCGGVTKKASVIGLSSAVQCYSFVVANSAAAMQCSALPNSAAAMQSSALPFFYPAALLTSEAFKKGAMTVRMMTLGITSLCITHSTYQVCNLLALVWTAEYSQYG